MLATNTSSILLKWKILRTVTSIPGVTLVILDTIGIFDDEHIESDIFRVFIKMTSILLTIFHLMSTFEHHKQAKTFVRFDFKIHTADIIIHVLIVLYSLCTYIIPYETRGISMEAHVVILFIHMLEIIGSIPMHYFLYFQIQQLRKKDETKRKLQTLRRKQTILLPKDIRLEETKQFL